MMQRGRALVIVGIGLAITTLVSIFILINSEIVYEPKPTLSEFRVDTTFGQLQCVQIVYNGSSYLKCGEAK